MNSVGLISKKRNNIGQVTYPTIVTPIGQGAFPIDRRRYESFAR